MTEKISEAQVGFTTEQQTAINSGVTSEDVTKARGALQTSDIVNNLTSTETNKSLSANMGKELSDRLDNVEGRGRFLSNWNCATGLPASNPPTSPYTYKAGDYYLVSVVSETTNYRPDGTSYTTGVPSTTVETEAVKVKDEYTFDGTVWVHKSVASSEVPFGSLTGQPTDNSNLAAALAAKQDKLIAGNGVKINSANVISIKPTYNSLTSYQKATLLSTGKYEGEEVASGTIFETDAGKFEKFQDNATSELTSTDYSSLFTDLMRHCYAAINGLDIFVYRNEQGYFKIKYRQAGTSSFSDVSIDSSSHATAYEPREIVYGNGKYVCAFSHDSGYSLEGIIVYSGSSFDNMTKTTIPDERADDYCLAYGLGKFIIKSSSKCYESTDGITWSEVSALSSLNGGGGTVASCEGAIFVAGYDISARRYKMYKSSDGSSWSLFRSSSGSSSMISVLSDAGYVHFWDPNVSKVVFSKDGSDWSKTYSGGVSGFAVIDGVFYIKSGTNLYTSTDFATWTLKTTVIDKMMRQGNNSFWFIQDYYPNILLNYSVQVTHDYLMTDLSYNKSELYNKTEVDTALGAKQGTLTAGANITIDSNNVISAAGGSGGASSLTDIAVAGVNVTFEDGPYKDFNIIGSLTFNNGVVSGFNSTNYIETKEALPSSITSFEMTMKFKTPSTISTSLVYPFLSKKGALTYIGIQGSTSKLVHSTGSLSGTTTLTANTEYTLKIKLENGSYNYYIDNVLQFSYSSLIYAGYVMEVGISKNYATGIGDGSIDLNSTSITVDGDNWWTPLQDIGTKKIINSTGLVNTATGSGSLTIQGTASTNNSSVNIGENSRSSVYGTALGNSAMATNNYGTAVGATTRVLRNYGIAVGSRATVSSGGSGYNGIALGYTATAGAAGAIMIGCGTNNDAKTLKVALNDTATAATTEATGLYTLLQADGTIPAGRVSNILEVVETLPASPVAGKIYFVTGS